GLVVFRHDAREGLQTRLERVVESGWVQVDAAEIVTEAVGAGDGYRGHVADDIADLHRDRHPAAADAVRHDEIDQVPGGRARRNRIRRIEPRATGAAPDRSGLHLLVADPNNHVYRWNSRGSRLCLVTGNGAESGSGNGHRLPGN